MSPFDRREFLRLALLAASAQLAPHRAWSFAPKPAPTASTKRILMVGAGLSGLAAAYELTQAGHDVTILEAQLRPIEELMADFGTMSRRLADDPSLRWLGPHKRVVHLALASITNACFDLWAKNRGVPLWKLLLDLSPEQVVALLDLSYVEDVVSRSDAPAILRAYACNRAAKSPQRISRL